MLINYLSKVPVNRSVQHIEDCLIKHNAKHILKKYDVEKKLEAICFYMPVDGKDMAFKLPAKVAEVEKLLKARTKRPTPATYARIKDQAERTAWKIQSDWVDVQMALVELKQVDLLQIFLGYIYWPAADQTFYEKIVKNMYLLPMEN